MSRDAPYMKRENSVEVLLSTQSHRQLFSRSSFLSLRPIPLKNGSARTRDLSGKGGAPANKLPRTYANSPSDGDCGDDFPLMLFVSDLTSRQCFEFFTISSSCDELHVLIYCRRRRRISKLSCFRPIGSWAFRLRARNACS